MGSSREVNLLVSFSDVDTLNRVIKYIRDFDLKINDLEITKGEEGDGLGSCATVALQLHRKIRLDTVLQDLASLEGVSEVEEL